MFDVVAWCTLLAELHFSETDNKYSWVLPRNCAVAGSWGRMAGFYVRRDILIALLRVWILETGIQASDAEAEARVLDHPTLRTQYPTVTRVRDGQPTERSSIPGKGQTLWRFKSSGLLSRLVGWQKRTIRKSVVPAFSVKQPKTVWRLSSTGFTGFFCKGLTWIKRPVRKPELSSISCRS